MHRASRLNNSVATSSTFTQASGIISEGGKKTMGKLVGKGICNADMKYASDVVFKTFAFSVL